MAHDYAPTHDYFYNQMHGTHWNWWEIQDSEIADACARCKLEPFMQDEFQRVAWACRRKA